MKLTEPLVSIITPTYNQAEYLQKAIESVLEQDYPNIEYLIINDGSTDNTESILRKYDGRIKWETQPNLKENPTINKALQMVNGAIIGKLSSDDLFYPTLVSEVVDTFIHHQDIVVAYPDYNLIDENDKIFSNHSMDYNFLDSIKNHACIPGVGAFYRRNILNEIHGLDTSFTRVADLLFWWKAGLSGPFHHIQKTLGAFRVHSGSQTYQGGMISAKETERLVKIFFQSTELPQEVLNIKNEAYSSAFFVAGIYASKEKSAFFYTTSYFLKSIFYYPPIYFSKKGVERINFMISFFLDSRLFRFFKKTYRKIIPKTTT